MSVTDKKIILNDISGEFKQFELSMILGQSGSGKTTLMNILSTYQSKGYDGKLEIDGCPISPKIIQQNSSFIMQEYKFYGFTTVRETMMFTVNCKFNTSLDVTTRGMKVSAKAKKSS